MTIHEFTGKARILFFPKRWANAVVRWIAGIHSPSGTVKVTPNMSPGDGGSMALDVDIDAVQSALVPRLDTRPLERAERDRFALILSGMTDESSVVFRNKTLSVRDEYVEEKCREAIDDRDDLVTINTAQTITAVKSFTKGISVKPDGSGDASDVVVYNGSSWSGSTARTKVATNEIIVELASNNVPTATTRIAIGSIAIAANSGERSFYFGTMSNGSFVAGARIYYDNNGNLVLRANDGSGAKSNGVLLAAAPTDTTQTNSIAIATLGWVNDKFIRKITSGTGVLFSTDGTVSIRGIGTGANQVAAGNHTHPEYENNGSSITLPSSDGILRNSSGTLSIDSKLTSLAAKLDDNGKVPLSQLTGNITGHSGTCLVTIGPDGSLGHSLNDAYYALESLAAYLGTGPNTGVFPLNCIIGTGDTGEIETIVTTDGGTFQKDKMLILKSGQGEKPRWTNISASNPGNSVTALNAASGATADNTTWTADSAPNATGVVVRQQTRTYWDGTNLYGFYRDWTYDKYGRLYSISAEVQYTIDTPTVAVWS